MQKIRVYLEDWQISNLITSNFPELEDSEIQICNVIHNPTSADSSLEIIVMSSENLIDASEYKNDLKRYRLDFELINKN